MVANENDRAGRCPDANAEAAEGAPRSLCFGSVRPTWLSVAVDAVRQQDAILTAYRFLDALNEREPDAMAAVVTDDAELRTSDGRVWRGGLDGARALIDAARQAKLRLIPLHRREHAEERGGVVWVELLVREVVEDADLPRIADIVVRDGRVASFALRPARYEPGLA